MDLVLSTHRLAAPGGSESYLTTVAHELTRLGHHVTVHATEVGVAAGAIAGLRLAHRASGLPERCDAVVVQDAAGAYELAARYPTVPQLFIAHSEYHDLQLPPQLPGVVGAAVALNDRVAARLAALAHPPRIVRLRQPIDRDLFHVPDRGLPDAPRRVLALGSRLGPARAAALARVCAEAGLELELTPSPEGPVTDVPARIARADVVVGYGRCILEAMAMGRAAFVWDHLGGDGWVSATSYPALEADGFAGHGTPEPVAVERLATELGRYEQAMGAVNRDLVELHHGAGRHAQEIVALVRELGSGARPPGPYDELRRLVLVQHRLESRELHLSHEVEVVRDRIRRERVERRLADDPSWTGRLRVRRRQN